MLLKILPEERCKAKIHFRAAKRWLPRVESKSKVESKSIATDLP